MKRTVKFGLFPKKAEGVIVESLPIRMRVSYNGYRVDMRVGYSIEPSKWNNETSRVIPNARNRYRQTAGEINKAIVNCEEAIEAIFTRFGLFGYTFLEYVSDLAFLGTRSWEYVPDMPILGTRPWRMYPIT